MGAKLKHSASLVATLVATLLYVRVAWRWGRWA